MRNKLNQNKTCWFPMFSAPPLFSYATQLSGPGKPSMGDGFPET